MIAVAFKDALKKIEATSNQKMGGLMPPGMNLPI
jgi:DNA-binding protein YbaB